MGLGIGYRISDSGCKGTKKYAHTQASLVIFSKKIVLLALLDTLVQKNRSPFSLESDFSFHRLSPYRLYPITDIR